VETCVGIGIGKGNFVSRPTRDPFFKLTVGDDRVSGRKREYPVRVGGALDPRPRQCRRTAVRVPLLGVLEAEQACRKHCPIVPTCLEFDEPSGITVTSLFPHFVDAQQSGMRGLTVGWYAIDQDGEIVSGPYRGRNECAISIAQSPDGAPALWSRP
jgi:hypothetical protein